MLLISFSVDGIGRALHQWLANSNDSSVGTLGLLITLFRGTPDANKKFARHNNIYIIVQNYPPRICPTTYSNFVHIIINAFQLAEYPLQILELVVHTTSLVRRGSISWTTEQHAQLLLVGAFRTTAAKFFRPFCSVSECSLMIMLLGNWAYCAHTSLKFGASVGACVIAKQVQVHKTHKLI